MLDIYKLTRISRLSNTLITPIRFRWYNNFTQYKRYTSTHTQQQQQPYTKDNNQSYYKYTATAFTLLGVAAVLSHNDDEHTHDGEPHKPHATNDINHADIPNDAPRWVRTLNCNSSYMYQDLQKLLDTTGHMIFDSLLHSPAGIEQFYYYAEIPPYLQQYHNNDNNTIHQSDVLLDAVVQKLKSQTQQQALSNINNDDTDSTSHNSTPSSHDIELSEWSPEIRAVFHLGKSVCGHKGVVHGGMSATLMDEVSGCAAFMTIGPSFTASLNVDYCIPLPANTWVLVRAKVVKSKGRKSYVSSSIEDGEGRVYARSSALFIKPKLLDIPASALFNAVQ